MFTIKHVMKEHNAQVSGVEREALYSGTKNVHKLIPEEYSTAVVQFIDTDKALITISSGVVYVMNENGKTVATYDLT